MMRDFTEGNIFKQLIVFTVPMLLANLLQAAYSIVDAIWVGRLIGYEAFAAVSATLPLIFFLVSAIIGLTMSTNILIGQAYGSKNIPYLKKVLSNSFISSMLLSLLISILSIVFTKPILHVLNTPENLRPYAHTFFVISVSGLVFGFGYNWFGAIMRGLGDSRTPLNLLIYSTVMNIIIVPALILGVGPIPKLGIAGAALGTVISSFAILVYAYFFVLNKHPLLNVREWDFTVDFEIIKKIFTIGVPVSLQMIIMSLSGLLIIAMVNSFGAPVTAAYGIGLRLDQLASMPAMAIGMSVSSMVAQNLGARKYERVEQILRYSLVIAILFSLFFFVFIYGFPKTIASVFTKEQNVILLTAEYIKIVSFTYFTFAIMFVLQGVVRGAGDTTIMLIMTFIAIILIRYPVALALSKTALKESGIWIAILSSTFIGLILNYIYYRSGRWKNRTVIPVIRPEEALDEGIEKNIV